MGFYLTTDKTWSHRQFIGEYHEKDFECHEALLAIVAIKCSRHAEQVTLGKIHEALGLRGLIQRRAIEALLDSSGVEDKLERLIKKALSWKWPKKD